MVSYPTPQSVQFNTFKGIRTRNGLASGGVISAVECKNIDFVPSSYDAGINIATSLGNVKVYELTGDYVNYNIVKGFEFESENATHLLFYCEYETNGVLLEYSNGQFSLIADSYSYYDPTEEQEENRWKTQEIDPTDWLTATNKANSIVIRKAYNTFVFTNGVDYYIWTPDAEQSVNILKKIQPKKDNYDPTTGDYVDTTIVTGLAMAEYNGALAVGGNEGLLAVSRADDITDFDNINDDSNNAWFEYFGKPITAIVSMTGGLIVFTDEDNTVITGTTADTRDRKNASLGGCLSFESWVKHDKYLFFYDNKQKNVYYYTQNDYGQMVLGEPVAPEVQKYFSSINRLQMTSYIGNNRSEIWVLTDKNKLLFDFFVKEWSERVCQNLNGYFVYDNDVFSVAGKKCFKEKSGNIGVFDGVFYGSEYKTQIINLGSFSNMKEMEFQPLLSVATDYNNIFYIECLIDGKKTKTKYAKMFNDRAVWGDDTEQDESTPDNELWDMQIYPIEDGSVIQQIKGKFISNWYYLQFTFRTYKKETDNPNDNEFGNDFSINCIELKGITQETDTTGRK